MTTGLSGSTSVVTPSGRTSSATVTVSPMSRSSMSTSMQRRDVGRLGLDRERLERLVDDATAVLDLLGLAHEDDRHVDGDEGVGVDPQEVDVQDVAPHRVALQVLHDGEVGLAVDVEGDQGVGARLGAEGTAQLRPGHGDGDRVTAEAVDDARHPALGPQARGRAGAGDAAGFGGEGQVHGGCSCDRRRGRGRGRRGRSCKRLAILPGRSPPCEPGHRRGAGRHGPRQWADRSEGPRSPPARTPSSAPARKTTGNSSPLALCRVIRATASARSS